MSAAKQLTERTALLHVLASAGGSSHGLAAAAARAAAADAAPDGAPARAASLAAAAAKDHPGAARSRLAYLRSLEWARPVATLAVLYACGLAVVASLVRRLPPLEELRAAAAAAGDARGAAALRLALPHSFDELRAVRATLAAYRASHPGGVAALIGTAYVFLQAFMMPGSMALNILAGSLYPFWTAFFFCAAASTAGASANFWLVRCLLRGVVAALFPRRVAAFQAEVARHGAHLLNFMLFVRVTPIAPAWFVNLASPIVGVPFGTFLLATAVGHQPINAISVQAGAALSTVDSVRDLYSPRNVACLLAAGALALAPVALKRERARRGGARRAARAPRAKLPLLPIVSAAAGEVELLLPEERRP